MREPKVTIHLERHSPRYRPGEIVSGEFRIDHAADVKAAELSVLWHTEGKGDEDLAVHFFERIARDDNAPQPVNWGRAFHVPLPIGPLSYEGIIVKIRWCLRVRVFFGRGKELVAEHPLQLGSLPIARISLS